MLKAACERDCLCPRSLVFSFLNLSFADVHLENLFILELSSKCVLDVLGLFLLSLVAVTVTLQPLMS